YPIHPETHGSALRTEGNGRGKDGLDYIAPAARGEAVFSPLFPGRGAGGKRTECRVRSIEWRGLGTGYFVLGTPYSTPSSPLPEGGAVWEISLQSGRWLPTITEAGNPPLILGRRDGNVQAAAGSGVPGRPGVRGQPCGLRHHRGQCR